MRKLKYCNFCCNASVEPDLTHDNDLSFLSVGKSIKGHSMYIRSGDNLPTAIIVSEFNDILRYNTDVCIYAPKYCPECGRHLFENKFDKENPAPVDAENGTQK